MYDIKNDKRTTKPPVFNMLQIQCCTFFIKKFPFCFRIGKMSSGLLTIFSWLFLIYLTAGVTALDIDDELGKR